MTSGMLHRSCSKRMWFIKSKCFLECGVMLVVVAVVVVAVVAAVAVAGAGRGEEKTISYRWYLNNYSSLKLSYL